MTTLGVPGRVRRRTASADRAAQKDESVRIFISYRREDERIARIVKTRLESLNDDILGESAIFCFTDQGIYAGEDWKERLDQELRRANYLIHIFTGQEESQWCTWEMSRFEVMHDGGGTARLCCFHEAGVIPKMLASYHTCLIKPFMPPEGTVADSANFVEQESAFYLESPCGQFINQLISGAVSERKSGAVLLKAINKHCADTAREITKAFIDGDKQIGEQVMHPRIWLDLKPSLVQRIQANAESRLPSETVVSTDSGSNALQIFGMGGNQTTWGAIREAFRMHSQSSRAAWMDELERAVIMATRKQIPPPSELTFRRIEATTEQSPDIYRPVLTRQKEFRSRRQKSYVVFMRARDRKLASDPGTSVLLALIIMASRFRYEVLKGNWSFENTGIERHVFYRQAHQFIELIEKAEYESVEFGVSDSALAAAFPAETLQSLREQGGVWYADKAAVCRIVEDINEEIPAKRKVILDFIEKWLPRNHQFLNAFAQQFAERVKH